MNIDEREALVLCCLLWAAPGHADDLSDYEDRVLSLLGDHDGAVVHRAIADGEDGRPNEVQIYRFGSRDALESYLSDPRRTAMSEERDRVIARTQLFPIRLTSGGGAS
ncbi:hypothetical protein FLP10_00690 [Agromyces intestinalis]|uniref:DUF1330 domain-containing protein n=1 Tax=Agromyces intestinalis TaxID=2592652 RepID=A0A5C1YAX2_9MICO|nr:hypothetical protein [Agromyces intestinalis]QEO13096.1 hypothetical protein FLP10_00690 [Agromyces intestinalis]